MTMHSPRLVGGAVALVASLAFAPQATAVFTAGQQAPSVKATNCSLKGSKTLAANRNVRVFQRADKVYGCRRQADRAYLLGIRGECQNNDEIDGVIVAGNNAALNVQTCSLTSSQSVALLVSLRSGRVTFASNPLSTVPRIDNGYDAIRGMAVTADGRLAWIGVGVERGVIVATEVRRRARGSSTRSVQLDSGTAIDPRSLHRRDSTVTWRNAGAVRSAPM
jgi:hypothetical protein